MTAAHTGDVLIFGRGFTSKYMAAELEAAGYRVRFATRRPQPGDIYADLLDFGSLQAAIAQTQPRFIVNLAGISLTTHPVDQDYMDAHVTGTDNLLRAAKSFAPDIDKILLIGSGVVYGPQEAERLHEGLTPNPQNAYGRSKLALEKVAETYFDDLPVLVTRTFNYTGPEQTLNFLIPKLVSHFKRRAPEIHLGNTNIYRDFSDVRAIVRDYRLLLESGASGEILNVCRGDMLSIQNILDMLSELTGHEIMVEKDPQLIREGEAVYRCGDASRLRSIIGDESYPDFVDTLKWFLSALGQQNSHIPKLRLAAG